MTSIASSLLIHPQLPVVGDQWPVKPLFYNPLYWPLTTGLATTPSKSPARSSLPQRSARSARYSLPSSVTAVHLSSSTRVSGPPMFTIGSMAITMPSRSFGHVLLPVVGNLRIFVQLGPNAMSDELANHAEAVRLRPACCTAAPTSPIVLPTPPPRFPAPATRASLPAASATRA